MPLAIVSKDRWRTPSMSLRRKTVPPTQKHSRSSSSGRKELIAKGKTEKQSVRKRTVLDNRFHRTRARSCHGPPLARQPSCLVNIPESRRHDGCRSRIASSRELRGNRRAAPASARRPWPCSLGSSRWADLKELAYEGSQTFECVLPFIGCHVHRRASFASAASARKRQSRQLAQVGGT